MLRVARVLVAAGALVCLAASPVWAVGGVGGSGESDDTQADPEISDEGVGVTLTANGFTAEGTAIRTTRTVGVPALCRYTRWLTGQRYYEFWTDERYQEALAQMPHQYRTQPLPAYETHQGDTDGYWFVTRCRADADLEQILAFNQAHPPVYWTPTDPVPAVRYEVDVRDLVEVAYEFADLPRGTIQWNPRAGGVGATLVGLDTWVWVEGAATEVSVRAEVNEGTTWAQVDAVLDRIELSAPGATPATCPGVGVPWSPEARSTPCAITFTRSSANQPLQAGQEVPTSTLTARAVWTASWTSSLGGGPQPLDAQEIVVTAQIPVAEVQALTTLG